MKKINLILMLVILISVILSTACIDPEDEDDFTGDAGTFTDQRDDNTYNWVRIGEQIWMAENLAYYNDTKSIAYNYDFNNVELYGYLYGSPNIEAPDGWHIPDKYEFLQLINYVTSTGYSNEEAYALKSTIGWGSQFNGIDKFGFRALPGGSAVLKRDGTDYNFNDIGISTSWWTTSSTTDPRGIVKPWLLKIQNNSDLTDLNNRTLGLSGAYSIRCIKN